MLVLKRLAALAATVTPGLLIGGAVLAGSGQPSPWQMGFQQAATPVMENIVWFHDFLLWLIVAITLFVLALLAIVVVRFNSRANPTPSRTTHNTLLEVMWTLVPVIILVAIAVPSFKLLFLELTVPPADVTVKATGKQWYWSYSYPDSKFEYDSLKREAEGDKRLYEELITKIREAGINAGFQSSTVRIADNARPGVKPVVMNHVTIKRVA